ncbi:hypothetical protein KZ395_02345, partial [Glaesserella parasuis]|nr:hypothetical protein [Glaesserella parasuis]MDE3952366.1 hypothetical protein [Glaesserella parasuis]
MTSSVNNSTQVKTYEVSVMKADVQTAVGDTFAKLDASNLTNQTHINAWKQKLGITSTTSSVELVEAQANSGITVSQPTDRTDGTTGKKYTLSLDAAKIKELSGVANSASKDLSNLDSAGKSVIQAATEVKHSADADNIASVTSATANDVKTYTVKVSKANVADAVKDVLDDNTKNQDLIDKIEENVQLNYKAGSETAKSTALSTGLQFVSQDTDQLTISTENGGKVKFDLQTGTFANNGLTATNGDTDKLATVGGVATAISSVNTALTTLINNKASKSLNDITAEAGQPHMLSIFQPTHRATAHLEIHLTNQQRSISLSYSAFSGAIEPSSTLIDAKLPDFPHPIHRSQHIRLLYRPHLAPNGLCFPLPNALARTSPIF